MRFLALFTLFFVGQLHATSREFKREGDVVSLKVVNELPYYCVDNSPTRVCLQTEVDKKIEVDRKVFETLEKKNWFNSKKDKKSESYFSQVTFKCFPKDFPEARLIHYQPSPLKNRPKVSVELQLDCKLKDPKKAQKYMQQTVDYLRETDGPIEKSQIGASLNQEQKNLLKKVLSGELLESKKFTPFTYCDLSVESYNQEALPVLRKEKDLMCEENYDNGDGTFFKSNCVDQDGKKQGYTNEGCTTYYSCDEEDMYEHDAKSYQLCSYGQYKDNMRDGEWKIFTKDVSYQITYEKGKKAYIELCKYKDNCELIQCEFENYTVEKEEKIIKERKCIGSRGPLKPFTCPAK